MLDHDDGSGRGDGASIGQLNGRGRGDGAEVDDATGCERRREQQTFERESALVDVPGRRSSVSQAVVAFLILGLMVPYTQGALSEALFQKISKAVNRSKGRVARLD